ncbi:MAG: TolC family outer membrane protein [Proteobacteria bacterium]|nr:TolC family outer membrane protein [Pseudomonadota bacterium]MBU1685906.1 TolC family outer membrane protein [Pseudomonadota bacterium]
MAHVKPLLDPVFSTKFISFFTIGVFCFFSLNSVADLKAATLAEAVQKAVSSNPEVMERFDALRSSSFEQRSAQGGYFPRIDLTSRLGMEWLDTNSFSRELHPGEISLTLSQRIYDGNATRNEFRRLGYNRLTRFYELLEITESIALETTRSFFDVLRYRRLTGLAEENYQQHLTIYEQVKKRTEAGIGRGVDLEQVTGRLALADSNRLTEATNLHDVSSRYFRIVGELPPEELSPPENLAEGISGIFASLLKEALRESPALHAAVEALQAIRVEYDVQRSVRSPRLDLRARHDLGTDRGSIDGQSDESALELVLSANLYRGGADTAAIRQSASKVTQVRHQKNKICRDLRQTLEIAHNDIQAYDRQLSQLDLHRNSIANVRMVYRKQFDIGQRTLLDLLDTENEYFQANRSFVGTSYDSLYAYARTQAAMGRLLKVLDLRQADLPSREDFLPVPTDLDPMSVCVENDQYPLMSEDPLPPSLNSDFDESFIWEFD